MIATLLFIAPVLAQSSDALAPAHEQLIEVATTTVQTVNEDTKKQTQVEEATVKQPEEYTLDEAINKFSSEYNIPRQWLVNLAKCESSYGIRLVGDNGNAYGPFQYWNRTWNYFEDLSNMNLNRNSMYDQTRLTAWALSNGYGGHWSCDYRTGKVK